MSGCSEAASAFGRVAKSVWTSFTPVEPLAPERSTAGLPLDGVCAQAVMATNVTIAAMNRVFVMVMILRTTPRVGKAPHSPNGYRGRVRGAGAPAPPRRERLLMVRRLSARRMRDAARRHRVHDRADIVGGGRSGRTGTIDGRIAIRARLGCGGLRRRLRRQDGADIVRRG